jgi:hypothetical protein
VPVGCEVKVSSMEPREESVEATDCEGATVRNALRDTSTDAELRGDDDTENVAEAEALADDSALCEAIDAVAVAENVGKDEMDGARDPAALAVKPRDAVPTTVPADEDVTRAESVGDADDEDESSADCERSADTVGCDECDVVDDGSPDGDGGAVTELLRVARVEALAVPDASADSLGGGVMELDSVALREAYDGVPVAVAQLDDDIRLVWLSPPDAVTRVEADSRCVIGAESDPAGDAVDDVEKNEPVASAEALIVAVSRPLELRAGEPLAYRDIICDIDGIVETRADEE